MLKRIAGIFLAVAFLAFSLPCACAEDLTVYFDIVPPDSTQQLSYTRQRPAFQIIAPNGWYMALANDEETADRAVFFKSDPRERLSEGHIQSPNIRVSFLSNPEGATAFMMTDDYSKQIKSEGGQILLEPEDIYADNLLGSHFTALDPDSNIIMDVYIFNKDMAYISVMAICSNAEFEGLKPEIKEAVGSIKF